MKSKRAREAAPAPAAGGKRAGEGVEEPPAKKHKSSGDGDEVTAKKAKKEKRDKRESRKEKKERMKDLQNLPGEDGEAEGEGLIEVGEKGEEKEKKEKKAKKDKKEKEKKEKKDKKEKKNKEEEEEEEEKEEEKEKKEDEETKKDKETKDERKKDKKKKEKKERGGEVESEKGTEEDKKDEEMGPAEEGTKGKDKKDKKDKKAKKAKEVNGDGEVKGEAKQEPSKNKKDKKNKAVKEQAEEASDRPGDEAGRSERHIVFVGNLPYTATAATIEAHFAPLALLAVRCLTQRDQPSACRGVAFVEFASAAAQRTCLDRFHHSLFDDGASPARRINVELTAGGGGRTELRRERIRDKNKKLEENRAKRIDKEKTAKLETDGADDKQQRMGDSIHPSRLARNPRLGH